MAEKYSGLFLALMVALLGGWSALTTDWSAGDSPILGGGRATAWQDAFDDALVIRDGAITAWATLHWHVFGQAQTGVVAGRDGWLFTAEEYETPPDFGTRLTHSLDRISQIQDRIESAGGNLVIALLPDKARVMPEAVLRERSDAVQARYDDTLDGLRARGLAVLDMRSVLTQARAEAPVFLKTDTHWTPFGARQVAAALAPSIVQAWTAAGQDLSVFETVAGPEQALEGDLMQYLPIYSPAAAGFGPLNVPSYATVVTGTGGLFSDAPPPAALVGTSFSANPNWHFDGWLKQETGVDFLNYALEGLGPFEPMKEFLDGVEDMPAVVVWEVPERYLTQ